MNKVKRNINYLQLSDPRPKLPKPNQCSMCNLKNKKLMWCGNKNTRIKYIEYSWKCKICFSIYNIM